jgi:A/G-specific adenine glycosylase
VAGAPLSVPQSQVLADTLVPARRSWEWNQALLEIGATWCPARAPACASFPLSGACAWFLGPARTSDPAPAPVRQTRFEGSDRQGRGRLVDALRSGPVPPGRLRAVCGWPQDPERARRIADGLVAEGLARRGPGNVLVLP